DYLRSLWQTAQDAAKVRPPGDTPSFYADLLHPLFFQALNVPPVARPSDEEHGRLMRVPGDVPFLNGGLFDPRSAWDQPGAVTIPNEAFDPLFTLFEDYRFTIDESTPDDIDMAVDPEMLGKVFEELVTGRHESGSYYTPRPVVAFMCREALKGYLADACPGEDPATVAAWVDGDDGRAADLRDPEAALYALKRVTVCDPACGSGAYLLGMMQELLRLRQSLFAAKAADHALVHDRKLEIIQRNLYGVDIDPFATNVAMLRLWLSLVVDDQRDPLDGRTDVSLPNLRFKIQTGDSLLGPTPVDSADDVLKQHYADLAARLRQLHDEYFRPGGETAGRPKEEVEAEIESIQAEIADQLGTQAPEGSIHWEVAFAEVFAPRKSGGRGFDIVLANPPYVRMELLKDIKPVLREVYPPVHAERADLYCYFYARAIQLLGPGGLLAFISSNKWFRAGYGARLREYVANTCRAVSITDFGELPVFQTAATFPMILVAVKGPWSGAPVFTQVKTLDPPYPDVAALIREQGMPLPAHALDGARWTLTDKVTADRLRKMEQAGVPLGEYVQGRIYYGVKTGLNEAFVIDGAKRAELIARDPSSAQIIRPLAVGDDVRRWRVSYRDRYLIYMPHGTDGSRYPAILDHLLPYRARLQNRATRQAWYELQQPQARYAATFLEPKIVYPDIAKEPRFA
ncbi:MAG TPA: DNA methyltransferase, partial [Desulfobacterales bacterium]|nr:DNA methyltransferase [Desulfobacterales bacterium]